MPTLPLVRPDRLIRRSERPDDGPFRERLFAESHGAWIATIDSALATTLIRQQMAAQAIAYAAEYPHAAFDIVEYDGLPIGRIVVNRGAQNHSLVDIALLSAWRGRGLGTLLLRALLHDAAALPVHLTVERDNPARRLYARFGFITVDETPTHRAMRWDPPGEA